MKVRAHVIVSGRVQGVFFRYETKKEALKRGVKGWVRNLPTGEVEAVFEGEKEDVEEMIKFCRKGPPLAKVKDVKVSWEEYKGEFEDFKIIH
ncbi:acylphosphatase [Candidatus Bathyarchaeota archaeon]|nr:MAG: acylphosphatase [Candidatus Bathyarchaeota archaeon]